MLIKRRTMMMLMTMIIIIIIIIISALLPVLSCAVECGPYTDWLAVQNVFICYICTFTGRL